MGRDGGLVHRDAEALGQGGEGLVEIVLEAKTLGVASGEKSGARWGADVGTNVAIGAANTGGGELVEDRRFDLEGAVAPEIAIPHVIREDHEDIGPGSLEGESEKEAEKKRTHAKGWRFLWVVTILEEASYFFRRLEETSPVGLAGRVACHLRSLVSRAAAVGSFFFFKS